MGPPASSPGFEPGKIVKIKKRLSRASSHQNSFVYRWQDYSEKIGTIIEMYVNISIDSGARVEKALVMWNDGNTLWVPISVLDVLDI